MVMCSVCEVAVAVRRGACWGCYSKFRREGLLDAVGERGDTSTRFVAAPSVSEALRALVGRLSPAARLQLHEATRPTADAAPGPGRVVRRG